MLTLLSLLLSPFVDALPVGSSRSRYRLGNHRVTPLRLHLLRPPNR